MKKLFFNIFILFLLNGYLMAQVKFKLTKLADGKTFQVSLIPEVDFQSPLNVTSTAQVTIKVPTGGFEVDQIFNLQPNVTWEPSSLSIAPKESPEHDYVSFGLVSLGTDKITYKAGEEVPLFAFTNFLECQGDISLFDNEKDPFAPPNSRQVNIGNQITILGAKGDAYIGNTTADTAPCEGFLTNVEELSPASVQLNIFPNPAKDYLTVALNWNRKNEPIDLKVRAIDGKLERIIPMKIINGLNQVKVDIQGLNQGNYFVEILGTNWSITSNTFIKLMH